MSIDSAKVHELSIEQLREENARLQARIRELELELEEPLSTVHAIREGLVDAVVIHRDPVPEVMTLESASEMYLRLAQRAAKVGTWQWDPTTGELNGSEIFWTLLGNTPTANADLGVWQAHLGDDDRLQFNAKVKAAIEEDEELCHELRIVGKAGECRWLDTRGHVLRSNDGSRRRLVGICLDITDRKCAEEALREADRRKDEFLATLAHELRNPLAPIRNSIDTLRLAGDVDKSTERIYETIAQQVTNLVRIVDDLLEVARISTGKICLRKELIAISKVLSSAVDTSRPLIAAARHELVVSMPDVQLLIEADPVRLSQVVSNLLNNAAKYTNPGGRIWLTVKESSNEILISVRDSGKGIPQAMLPRVFDMFAQLQRDEQQAQGGLGIGLALVKNLVELHGGCVEVQSAGPDQGSEFTIHLPVAAPNTELAHTVKKSRHRKTATGHRILVVDDNEDGASALAKLLQKMGNEVRIANSGSSALTELTTWSPHIILLDLGMPGMDGYEVARQIRLRSELNNTFVVALTGWGQSDDRRKTQEAGFDHHLVKPVAGDALRDLLARIDLNSSVQSVSHN
jgi:PAS domain S-box-containing protein